MSNKILTIVSDSIEYVTKKRQKDDSVKFVMKTSNSSEWSDINRNKKILTAWDTGDDLHIEFKSRDEDGKIQKHGLAFDYEQAFELYCFLDMWHRTDPYFAQPTHVNKNISK